nr:hypothetical protein OG284_35920 [Streptomyces sp. NBC_01177]
MWKTTNKSTLPQQLRLTDPGVREQLEALPASQVLIGHGTDGQPVCVDLDNESPHVLVYSASGGGTSTALLPDEHAARALADVVLDESDRRLSVRMEGTVRCVQGRARLVRALYERLDRLVGAAPELVSTL